MSSERWTLKYRPKTFSAVYGQADKALLWYGIKQHGVVAPVLLFCGPSGVGKTTLARITAAALNCSALDNGEPCGECSNCQMVFSDSHSSVYEINAAMNGGADDMRRLHEQAYLFTGGHNVFIIDEAHSLSWQAWNVLLKLFEEPPSDTTFILVTSEPAKVPVKIRTRATRYDFSYLPAEKLSDVITAVAAAENYEIDQSIIDSIIDAAGGSPREAIKQLEESYNGTPVENTELYTALKFIRAAVVSDRTEAVTLMSGLWEKYGDAKYCITCVGDAMEKLLYYTHDIPVYTSSKTTEIISILSDSVDDLRWAAAMEVLSDWYFRSTSKPHLTFMTTQFIRALHGPAVVSPTKVSTPVKDDTLPRGALSTLIGKVE